MNRKIQDAFNKQVNYELFSAYLYVSMGAYFESLSLKGMANWMFVQAQEELQHANRFMNYMNERGGRVLLEAIEGPRTEWSSPLEVFQDTYKHECLVTSKINGLVDIAQSESDHAALNFLQWFISEQVEEEAASQEIVDHLKLVGDNGVALFMIDKELSTRTLTPIADTQA